MPDGPTHSLATLVGCAAATAAMTYAQVPVSQQAYVVGGFLLSLSINPDLDLNRKFPRKNPSKWLWWILWWPYSRLVGHRSPISHWPLIGTAFRVIYLLPLMWLISFLLEVPLQIVSEPCFNIFIGLVVSDTLHAGLDAASTIIKELRRLV